MIMPQYPAAFPPVQSSALSSLFKQEMPEPVSVGASSVWHGLLTLPGYKLGLRVYGQRGPQIGRSFKRPFLTCVGLASLQAVQCNSAACAAWQAKLQTLKETGLTAEQKAGILSAGGQAFKCSEEPKKPPARDEPQE